MKELDDDLGSRASVLAPDMKNEDGGDEDERHDEHGHGSAAINNLHRCSVLSRQKKQKSIIWWFSPKGLYTTGRFLVVKSYTKLVFRIIGNKIAKTHILSPVESSV